MYIKLEYTENVGREMDELLSRITNLRPQFESEQINYENCNATV